MRGDPQREERSKSSSLATTCASGAIITLLIGGLLLFYLINKNKASYGDDLLRIALTYGLSYGIPAVILIGLSLVCFAFSNTLWGKRMAAIVIAVEGVGLVALCPFMVIRFNAVEFLISLAVIALCCFGLSFITFKQIQEDGQN